MILLTERKKNVVEKQSKNDTDSAEAYDNREQAHEWQKKSYKMSCDLQCKVGIIFAGNAVRGGEMQEKCTWRTEGLESCVSRPPACTCGGA